MQQWQWIAATCRGTSHVRSGLRLQDAQSCFVQHTACHPIFISIVSDGAGSAEFGGQGASLACRSISQQIRRHFKTNNHVPTEIDCLEWIDCARDLIFEAARRRDLPPREFACTLILAITDGVQTHIAHIGDGCVAVKNEDSGNWIALSWPDHGEYASTTYFITDEPSAKLRFNAYLNPISALVAFSDGIERLALDFQSQQPHVKFFEGICRPLINNSLIGYNRDLTRRLRDYLDSDPVNNRTDDDKTLVIAVRK